MLLASAIVGAILGFFAAHALFLGWWTLVPWGIAGMALGYKFKKSFVVTGIVYGFVLVFVFMIFQYNGERPLISRFPFFAIFALFGAVCGLILTTIGAFAKRLLTHTASR